MKIYQIPKGPIEANCYVIETETSLVIIDPCAPYFELPKIDKPVFAIIITHCHYDHISYMNEIKEKSKALIYSHSSEFPGFSDPVKNGSAFFLMEESYPLPDRNLQDGEILKPDDDIILKIIHTPGHTMGSICILASEKNKEIAVFTGDTLFKESAGRTDLGGSPIMLKNSLARLGLLNDDVKVYSGHGTESTIGHEKIYNPFM